jgi:hypothetical protein
MAIPRTIMAAAEVVVIMVAVVVPATMVAVEQAARPIMAD